MSFYLVSEALTCFGFCSGAYQSLKVLHRHERLTESQSVLKLWAVLGTISLFQQYFEVFVSWFPFYYWLKCALLVALLTPKTNIPLVAFENLVVPLVEAAEVTYKEKIKPEVLQLAARHGHWLHFAVMQIALPNLTNAELDKMEIELLRRLDEIKALKASRGNE
ncbi:hypothetical protein THRCLA_21108 [Thraustotheca clavata]|uniref:Uncharacterized protein n=1 Tax=Thraustotheca clavata TaxID=74557 RepID=A0A1W0A0F6_9STRA|nr:hypothetical protein THRCLA_21108 [Thraustotheca clavata]